MKSSMPQKFIGMSLLVLMLALAMAVPNLAWAQTPPTKTITVTTTWVNDDTTVRPDDVTVHIKKTNSVLKTGTELEVMMKSLSGSGSENSQNTTVRAIKQATKAQYDAIKSTLTASNQMQASGEPSYMWFDSGTGTIYLYSEADNVYFNNQAQNMCRKFTNLTDITGLSMFNTSRATNMSRMFQDSVSLADYSPVAGWDVSHVTDLTFTFGATSPSTNVMQMSSLEPLRNWDVSSVALFDQTFKGCRHIPTLEPLQKWNVSASTNCKQMFNWCVALDDDTRDYIKGWDVRGVTVFDNMFNNNGEILKPIFTQRPGSWSSSGGSYAPDDGAITPASPTAPEPLPATETEYTSNDSVCSVAKNGNTWTYTFTVPNDGSTWTLWEDTGATFNDKNGLANAYKQESGGTQGSGSSEATAHTNIKPGGSVSFTHTNTMRKEITVTKAWDDKNNAYNTRPTSVNGVNLRLQLNGTDVKSTASPAANDITTDWNTTNWSYTFVVYDDDPITSYSVAETFADNRYTNNAPVTVTAGPTTSGVETGSATVTNTLKLFDMTVKCEATGNVADKTKVFTYRVNIGNTRSYDYVVLDESGAQKQAGTLRNGGTVSMTDGDKLVVSDFLLGTTFTVTQTTTDASYTSTATSSAGGDAVSGLAVSGTMDDDRTITYNNHRSYTLPTGLMTRDGAPRVMLIVAGMLTMLLLLNRYRQFGRARRFDRF